ncbi:MAG: hypothetical protein ACHQ1H_07265 [Nitrososphaerales archaeon]
MNQVLTIAVVAVGVLSAGFLILGQFLQNTANYGDEISYSFSRISLRYDYSCDENVYGIYLVLNNSGLRTVQGLSLSITNELCLGSIPPIPSSFLPQQSLKLYLYSTSVNGTITISGNNTMIMIPF